MKKTMINEASSYETPLVRVIALNCEGILCGSRDLPQTEAPEIDEDGGNIDFGFDF